LFRAPADDGALQHAFMIDRSPSGIDHERQAQRRRPTGWRGGTASAVSPRPAFTTGRRPMRLLLIVLYAIVSCIAFQAPAQAKTLTYAEVETVCGTHATTGVDEYGRTYIYCMRLCGVNLDEVCYYRCRGLVCEGWVFSQTNDPGTGPDGRPNPLHNPTHSVAESLSSSGSEPAGGGTGGGGGGGGGASTGATHGSFATTASPGGGGAPSLL
jgi:uncharacterized membrane protein YgcG